MVDGLSKKESATAAVPSSPSSSRAQMKGMRKRVFPFHYDPEKKLLQIVVKLSDAPGSLSAILEVVRSKVNLIGTSTYTLSDGTAILSAFAESLVPGENPEDLAVAIRASRAALEVDVREGRDGVLVDSFHTGLEVGGEEYLLLRREGLSHVFDQVVKLLGTGGEALLYAEGVSMGERNSKNMAKLIGRDKVAALSDYLRSILSAEGWGVIERGAVGGENQYHVRVKDCFECAASEGSRQGCSFVRGYLEASASSTFGISLTSSEVKCVMNGDPYCEFLLAPEGRKRS